MSHWCLEKQSLWAESMFTYCISSSWSLACRDRLSHSNEVNCYYNCLKPTNGTGSSGLGCCLDVSIQGVPGRMRHAVGGRSVVSITMTQPNVPSSWMATETNDARKMRFSCDSAYCTYFNMACYPCNTQIRPWAGSQDKSWGEECAV